MLISVIIPTCDRPEQLCLCLDGLNPSCQSISSDEYEVVVSDDSRHGATLELIGSRFPWVKAIKGPKCGPGANRNHGAANSKGEWLVFIDDDCIPDHNWLTNFAAAIIDDVDVYEGKTTCKIGCRSPLEIAPVNEGGGMLWSCNMMLRRQTFESLGGFDESFPHAFMEDVDFRERLKDRNIEFKFVPSAIVDHPPRRVAWGNKLALTQESAVKYWYKRGNTGSCANTLLFYVLKFRVSAIRNSRLNLDSVLAIFSLLSELIVLSCLVVKWEKRYRLEYILPSSQTNRAVPPS